ncbi:MAG TPA: DUF6498-containing protein [Ardenticatenaceae bacterium]
MRFSRLLHMAQLVLLNGVPAWGVFSEQWSTATALGLYWCENLLATLFIAARIALHSRLTRKRGHYRGQLYQVTSTVRTESESRRSTVTKAGTFLGGYLIVAIPFALAHGLFLGVLLFLMFPNLPGGQGRVEAASLYDGLVAVSLLLVFDFLLDLYDLRQQPFAWVRRMVDFSLSRMIVVHLTIILGMIGFAASGQPRSLFAVFVVLKTMADLSVRLPQYDPEEPPQWLVRLLSRFGPEEEFRDYWRKEWRTRKQSEEEDEELSVARG